MLYEAKKKAVEFLKEKFMVMQELGMHTSRKNMKLPLLNIADYEKYHSYIVRLQWRSTTVKRGQ